jgi:hypothetical protein
MCSMLTLLGSILLCGFPAQILRTIVISASIPVRHLVPFWPETVEGFTNSYM